MHPKMYETRAEAIARTELNYPSFVTQLGPSLNIIKLIGLAPEAVVVCFAHHRQLNPRASS